MKERPIIFKTEMVEAILAGRKTQTRRIMRDQPRWDSMLNAWSVPFGYCQNPRKSSTLLDQVAYAQVGDVLWVKENFKCWIGANTLSPKECLEEGYHPIFSRPSEGRLRPSIHMPREFSRLTLEVTDVRVMRLQDISEGDAAAEGVEENLCADTSKCIAFNGKECCGKSEWFNYESIDSLPCYSAKDSFMTLWESIHGKGSWDQNPWVFAYTFKIKEVKP